MAMTNKEQEVIQNIIDRLSAPNCGCHNGFETDKIVAEANGQGIECVARLYLDSWVIPALKMMLPGEGHNVDLARRLSDWNR